jgi:peptidoglycan/LPS O-acetylase OafA/YrhL
MRATAILLVLLCHGSIFYKPQPYWMWLYPYGYFGVDLFFVLSGFLIGGMLFRTFARKRDTDTLGDFWTRRFFRTMPNYVLFLLINLAIAFWFREELAPVWKYFVFAQNLTSAPSRFFGESWTLAIEVWFYIATPILFFIAFKIAPNKFRIISLLVVLAGIVAITIVRSRVVTVMYPLALTGVRMTVVYRVDACLFGVIAAWVKHFYPALFPRGRYIVFAFGLAVIVAAIYFNAHPTHSVFYRRAGFVASPLGAMLILPLMYSWRAIPRGGEFVVKLSLWAYALYLANLPLQKLVQRFFPYFSPFGKVLLFVPLCFLVAEFVYTFYEKPLMDLRDRWPFRKRTLAPRSSLERQAAGI